MLAATIGHARLELVEGDITQEAVDAVVTAANSELAGGGGVDGAIHRAAGPELLRECRKIGGCPPGEAVATPPGRLPVKFVIHAVGPIYGENEGRDAALLASAHLRSLEVAAAAGCTSIAFPAISCGVYGYPIDQAAQIALSTIRDVLLARGPIARVRYCLFGDPTYQVFAAVLRAYAAADPRIELSGG